MSAGPPLFWSSFGSPQIAPAGAADGSLAEPAGYVESAPATAYADARAQGGEPMLLRTVSQPQIAPPSHPTFYTSSPNGYNNSYVEMAGYQP
jgi:hypothetical protein